MNIDIRLISANQIGESSWLMEDEFTDFRKAYEYASTQTRAISALSKCTPEEIYFVFDALKDGEKRIIKSG